MVSWAVRCRSHIYQNMQANIFEQLRDRERGGDSRVAGEGPEAGEDEALASSRTEAWERVEYTMQEADDPESDGGNATAMLASLGCGEGAGSIPVEAAGGDSLSDSRVAGQGVAAGEDAARVRKVQHMTAMLASLGCGEVLARSILPDTAEGDTMTVLAQLSQEKITQLFQAAVAEMAKRVGEGVEVWKAGTHAAEEADASGKFIDGKYGSLALFDTGLEGYVGLPDVNVYKAMMREHTSKEKFSPSNNKGTQP